MQVTIIGGGSYQWTPKLMTDLLATPSLAGCHLVLMDIDPTPLPKMAALVNRANEALAPGPPSRRPPTAGTAQWLPHFARAGRMAVTPK